MKEGGRTVARTDVLGCSGLLVDMGVGMVVTVCPLFTDVLVGVTTRRVARSVFAVPRCVRVFIAVCQGSEYARTRWRHALPLRKGRSFLLVFGLTMLR